MEKIDFKKVYKDIYLPKPEPTEIYVPAMNFIMVDGKGNPNLKAGEYEKAVELLYALTFTIKMSVKSGREPKGYFEYVVPPLEGMWWFDEDNSMDYTKKDKFCWTSMIRQPEFVTEEVFLWACTEVSRKKPDLDINNARFKTFEEGLCVQIMHIGPYDTEPKSLAKIDAFIKEHDLKDDISAKLPEGVIRRHHEIYLSDPRKSKPESLKTVLRHPVR